MKIVKWTGNTKDIVDFYKSVDYIYKPKQNEKVIAALNDKQKILGVVRLSEEKGMLHLRGMQIRKKDRSKGIGTIMLSYLDNLIGEKSCYLVGYPHLASFYNQIGFKEITPENVPKTVRDRFENAIKKFPRTEFNIMYRKDRSS